MPTSMWPVAALFLAVATASAQDQPEKKAPAKATAGQEAYRAVLKDYSAALVELQKQLAAAASAEERAKLEEQKTGLIGKFSDRFYKIVAEYPNDPAAEEALGRLSMQLGINAKTEDDGARSLCPAGREVSEVAAHPHGAGHGQVLRCDGLGKAAASTDGGRRRREGPEPGVPRPRGEPSCPS